MPQEGDPYRLLGVTRNASLEEVRLAYRNAVLRYHPDTCQGDPSASADRFHELTDAYKTISRSLDPRAEVERDWISDRTYTPQDFSRLGIHWQVTAQEAPEPDDRMEWRGGQPPRKYSFATRDENKVFVCFWIVAMVLGVAVAVVYHALRFRPAAGDPGMADMVALWALPLVIYVTILAATVIGLLLSRKVVWLIVQLAVRVRRALPAPAATELPGRTQADPSQGD